MFANMERKSHKPITAWDVSVDKEVKMLNPKIITMKNKRLAWTGKSSASGNKVFRIIGNKNNC